MARARMPGSFHTGRLESFLEESCSSKDVLSFLVSDGRSRTLKALKTPHLPTDNIVRWLAVIAKALRCETDKPMVIDLLTMVLGTGFFTSEIATALSTLTRDSSEEDIIQYIQNLVDIVNQIFLRLPHSFTDVFGHIVIIKKTTDEMLLTTTGTNRQRLQSLSDTAENLKDTALKRMTVYNKNQGESKCKPPPDDFRTIPILPGTSDIFLGSRKVYLRKNKAVGGYENLDHYLDVQFRLYREDCVSPLRDGITEYVRAVNFGQNIGRLQDGKLYKKVVAISSESTIEGEEYVIKLDKEHASKFNWMSSRRLIYGSLVCLSNDNFCKIHFAVVSNSDRKDLQKKFEFKVVCPSNDLLPLNTDMTMVESSAFFEAYRHVLAGLQNIAEGELPFEKYIVKCRKNVDPPVYLTNRATEYDLQPIISNQSIFKEKCPRRNYRTLHLASDGANNDSEKKCMVGTLSPISKWPKAEKLHLDQSQFEAFHAALTQEFVLIQGPPGTGKTHVALQIAKTLLHNKTVWATEETNIQGLIKEKTCPMLVVCFTNHALDQFMEGIVKCLDPGAKGSWKKDIVRVGGRCENETIEEFSLKNRRRLFRFGRVDVEEIFGSVQNLQKNIADTKYRLRKLKSVVFDAAQLQPVMSAQHYKAFEVETCGSNKLFQWLGADEKIWLQEAQRKYFQQLKSFHQSQVEVEKWKTQTHEELLVVKTDAELLEDDRRIEDDTVASLKVDKNIGLNMKIIISNMCQQDNSEWNVPQMDDTFKTLFTQEVTKTFARLITHSAMTDEEADLCSTFDVQKLFSFSLNDRWRLYRYWVRKYKAMQEEMLSRLKRELADVLKNYEKEKKQIDALVLKTASVIAMTTSGAARYHDVLKDVGPRIVIVEEAAEVLETHIVTALSPKCQHLILIGDHKQLEPKPSVYRLEQQYNLGLSMFERMLNNGIENHCLQRQHRMRPDISTLVRDIYSVLEDNENVFKYDHVLGIEKNVFFINHNSPEDYGGDTRSYSNTHEAAYVVALCRHLMKQGYATNQITILAAYSGQMFCIRNLMPRNEFEGIRAVAIDNFQGEETDIILLSLVRSNKTGNIGFLKRENRVCVALSRAKMGLYVVGNFSMFEEGSPLWAKIIQKTKSTDQFGNALPVVCQRHPDIRTPMADAADFIRSPEGGCDRKCDFRLSCGHVCRLFCHPRDKTHTKYKCKEKCKKTCPNDHVCQKTCHFDEECKCPMRVMTELPCGHEASMECHKSPEAYNCKEVVNKTLPCGHTLLLECNINPKSVKCEELVNRTLERCGHDASMKCFVDPTTFKCRKLVTRVLGPCGHEATMECQVNALTYRCRKIVTRELQACEHKADLECWVDSEKYKCAVMLRKHREMCGHSFDVLCSEYSSSYERKTLCNTVVSKCFPKCQHWVDVACHVDITDVKCEMIVTKHWHCSHTAELPCWTTANAVCEQKCLQMCSSGHTCNKICHYPEKCICKQLVDKALPNCSHIQNMECHEDPSRVSCTKMVLKELPRCAHMKEMPCHEDPNSTICDFLVKKAFIPCGHIEELKCSLDVSKIKCKKIISKRIELCGHSQAMPCSLDPCSFECASLVDKVLPQCGHTKKLKCSVDPNHHKCNAIVVKELRCGHEIKMQCCKSPNESIPCRVKVQMPRQTCSHTIGIECSQRNRTDPDKLKCYKLTKQQQVCGHERSVECWTSNIQKPCDQKCNVTLLCGHRCGGKCKKCSENLFHETCKTSCCKVLICGHSCSSKKCGSCLPCNTQCDNYCPHRRCSHACETECEPCKEKCSVGCPHHQCSRLCSEQCDRPRCNLRCPQILQCQHRCMGYCGDPCPTSCFTCRTKADQKVICEDVPSPDTRFVRLVDCGHEFESSYLDRIVDRKMNALEILRCPKCKKTVRWHPRYVNVLKTQWEAIDSVKSSLNFHRHPYKWESKIPLSKTGSNVSEINVYIRRFRTYLYIQQRLHHGTISTKILFQWAVSFMQMLEMFLTNSRRDTELTLEQIHCINRNMCKLSAVWLLLIGSQSKNRSASGELLGIGTNEQLSNDHRTESNTEEEKTLSKVENFIRKTHTFSTSDLQKVMEMLEPFLINTSEEAIAFDFPILEALGIHRDDWITCDNGHPRPSDIWSKTCSTCSNTNLLTQHALDDGNGRGSDGYGSCQTRGNGHGRDQNRFRGRGRRGHGEPVMSLKSLMPNPTTTVENKKTVEHSKQKRYQDRAGKNQNIKSRGGRGHGLGGGHGGEHGDGENHRVGRGERTHQGNESDKYDRESVEKQDKISGVVEEGEKRQQNEGYGKECSGENRRGNPETGHGSGKGVGETRDESSKGACGKKNKEHDRGKNSSRGGRRDGEDKGGSNKGNTHRGRERGGDSNRGCGVGGGGGRGRGGHGDGNGRGTGEGGKAGSGAEYGGASKRGHGGGRGGGSRGGRGGRYKGGYGRGGRGGRHVSSS